MKKTLRLSPLIVPLIVVLAACRPAAPDRTLDRPVRTAPATRITMLAPAAPYLPDSQAEGGGWPTRPLTIIVPFLPGGDTNLYARMFAPFLAEILGQPVYVINVDGASGTVGAAWVSSSAPDGYTMLFYHTGNLFANVLTGATELNHRDFEIACIAMHCDANVLLIHSDVGINSAGEFLTHIRAHPGSLSVATTITGFSFKLLRMAELAGGFSINAVHVGGGSMMPPSVLGGHTEMAYNNVALFLPYIESGEIIPLWVASGQRNAHLPDVPTIAEAGIEGGYMGRSYFFAFPIGTDELIMRRLSDAVRRITENPLFQERVFATTGMPSFFVPFEEAGAYLDEMWAHLEGLEAYMRR
ncbi:MAG: tripartite tricarboxylate transporter substrate binding protein [Treponema sp.]|nr:tripartite tricarboxylate transporter substrate binding protein [Treponema sp.]